MIAKLNWRLRSLALAAAVCASGCLAFAQDSALQLRVDLYLKDADLLGATLALTRQTGIQFVIAPSSEPFNKINLSLKNRTAEEAIKYLCEAAGAYAVRDENGVFTIRRGKPEEAVKAPLPEVKVKRPSIIKKIPLMKADPKTVYDMLVNDYVFDPAEGFVQMQRFANSTRTNDLPRLGPSLSVFGSQGQSATTYPMTNIGQPSSTQNTGAGGTTPTNATDGTSSIVLPGESTYQAGLGGGGGGGFGGGQPGGGGNQPGGQGNQNTTLNPGDGLVPDGIEYITYDPTDNSIVVKGPDDAVAALQRVIAFFDVAPKQVIIKVEFVTVGSKVFKSLGFNWTYARGGIVAGGRDDTFLVDGPVFLNYATGNIVTRLRTALSTSASRTVDAPQVRTLNNQIASVAFSSDVTVFINQVVNGPGGVIVIPQPLTYTATTQLVVRPRINGDGTVTVGLTPQIQGFRGFTQGPDGQQIPNRFTQAINVVARVKNNETIALAGFGNKFDDTSQNRFPILADLPIIGQFFRTNRTQKDSSELLIFVTPQVVDEDDTTGGP